MKLNAGKANSKKTFTPNLDLPPKNVTLRIQVNTLLLSPRSIKKKTSNILKDIHQCLLLLN